jgi:hypothetical protein
VKTRPSPWRLPSFVLASALGVVAVGGAVAPARAEPSDEALMGIGMLKVATDQLSKVPRDKDGHKQKALEATKKASSELWTLAFGDKPQDGDK